MLYQLNEPSVWCRMLNLTSSDSSVCSRKETNMMQHYAYSKLVIRPRGISCSCIIAWSTDAWKIRFVLLSYMDWKVFNSVKSRWENWRENLTGLSHIQVGKGRATAVFCMVGNGRCSYLRQTDSEENSHCSLMLKAPGADNPCVELSPAVPSIRISALLQRELDMEYEKCL